MFRKTLRTLAVLALVTLTTTSAAHAANTAGRSFSGLEISDRLSEVWERIAAWFQPLTGRSALTKEGSSMDPNGGHTNPGTTNGTSSDAGSQMDPNG
ncbi:MAG TPA: hypothetical protein VH988_04415 [Thermoanaerobaculia bacterium]|jgi:hypothetical protein|nr:hypothetical protein [Thermoanaerobaculia bacterium]